MENDKINLGDKVKDTISGFEGIATAIIHYLNGCNHIGIAPQVLHDGATIEVHYFDDQQCELIEAGVVEVGNREPGGPMLSKPPAMPHP